MGNIDSLNTEQKDQAIRFLLHRMGPDTRKAMMAQLPVVYTTLYPATVSFVIGAVCEQLNAIHEPTSTEETTTSDERAPVRAGRP